jgi:hypothetical protein
MRTSPRLTAARLGVAAALALTSWAARADAFGLVGHEIIEATAYKRLMVMPVVPGAGVPGRTVLATLIATNVLRPPPCFDRSRFSPDCEEALRLDLPLRHWPVLGAGAPDLVIDRQLGQTGQCQHFMARTDDGTSPIDPRFGVPRDLVIAAYTRCVQVASLAFDGILADPARASWRLVGMYALIHGLEDSFSAAHVHRDQQLHLVHLLSWKLIDWPRYLWTGKSAIGFAPETHHAVTDDRDYEYLKEDAIAPDGQACRSFLHPYAVPEACLTPRALAAVDAVVDLLVLTYRLRAGPDGQARPASILADSEARTSWQGYIDQHFSSVATKADVPRERFTQAPRRTDWFVGAHAGLGEDAWAAGVWGAHLSFVKPVIPFALVSSGGVIYSRVRGVGGLTAVYSLGLALPLVRRFTIGASPAGIAIGCDTNATHCSVDLTAGAGVLLIPLGQSTWLGLEGPRFSWLDRRWNDVWFGLAFGWSYEDVPRPRAFLPDAVAAWNPPRPDEVRAYRSTRTTRALYVGASIVSRSDDASFGLGVDWRRDRDAWNRRSGLGAELDFAVYQGRIDAATLSGGVAAAAALRAYLIPDLLSVVASPAVVRAGALGSGRVGVDVGARAGMALQLGNVELGVDSHAFSYVSRDLWHAFPIAVRLGALLD